MAKGNGKTTVTKRRSAMEIAQIERELSQLGKGDVVPLEKLAKIVGRRLDANKPGSAYHSLHTARINLTRTKGMVFDFVFTSFGDGEVIQKAIKRLDDSESVRHLQRDINRLRGLVDLLGDRIEVVNPTVYAALSDEDKALWNTYESMRRPVAAIISAEFQEKAFEEVKAGRSPIPTKRVMLMIPQ